MWNDFNIKMISHTIFHDSNLQKFWSFQVKENHTEASSSITIGLFPSFSKNSYACRACCSQESDPSSWCTLVAAAANSSKSNFLYGREQTWNRRKHEWKQSWYQDASWTGNKEIEHHKVKKNQTKRTLWEYRVNVIKNTRLFHCISWVLHQGLWAEAQFIMTVANGSGKLLDDVSSEIIFFSFSHSIQQKYQYGPPFSNESYWPG